MSSFQAYTQRVKEKYFGLVKKEIERTQCFMLYYREGCDAKLPCPFTLQEYVHLDLYLDINRKWTYAKLDVIGIHLDCLIFKDQQFSPVVCACNLRCSQII